jgi:DNA-binding transcriptional LysR family regulator
VKEAKKLLNENRIRCFLTLSETLNFTETAMLLYMTQQGVSSHISSIEKELGFPLFTRTHRSVKLTEEGRRCYDMFSKILKEYTEFKESSREKYAKNNNTLYVGYQNWLDFGSILSNVLSALNKNMPGLEIVGGRYVPIELTHRLLDETLDMIILREYFAPQSPSLKKLELTRIPLVLRVARGHPLNGPDATYKTFSRETFIVESFENRAPPDVVSHALKRLQSYGFSPSKVLVVPNRDSIYTAVRLGKGVTVGSSIAHVFDKPTLREYNMDIWESLVCVWKEGGKSKLAEHYATLLKQEYASQQKSDTDIDNKEGAGISLS